MATPTVVISDEEELLQQTLEEYIEEGRAREATDYYRQRWVMGHDMDSARTHHLALLAACDWGAGDELVNSIYAHAEKCQNFGSHKLNLDREKAVRLAERRPKRTRDFPAALAAIDEVISSRIEEEGEDSLELQNDWVAKAKILILKGDVHSAYDILRKMRGRREGQTRLNVEFWYSVAVLCCGWYEHAIHLSQKNLTPDHGDQKPNRRRLWKLMVLRWERPSWVKVYYGAPLARLVIWWKL